MCAYARQRSDTSQRKPVWRTARSPLRQKDGAMLRRKLQTNKLNRGRATALFDGRNSAPTGRMGKKVNNWIQMPLCGWYDNALCSLQKVRDGHPKTVKNDDTYCRVTFQRERQTEYTVFTKGRYSPLWRQPGSQFCMIFSLKAYSWKCITQLRGQH